MIEADYFLPADLPAENFDQAPYRSRCDEFFSRDGFTALHPVNPAIDTLLTPKEYE
jgi:hypothetical protein